MKNYTKISLLTATLGLSMIPVLASTISSNCVKTVHQDSDVFYDEAMNNAVDNKVNIDKYDSTLNYKIDVTTGGLKYLDTHRVREFYQSPELFDDLVKTIKLHPDILFDWSTDNNRRITNVEINQDNDLTIMSVGAAQMPRSVNKDLNGRLYIRVTIEERSVSGEVLPPRPPFNFILCGFKRDASTLLGYNEQTKNISRALYNSMKYGTRIKLNVNNQIKNTEFVLSNMFYYKDYLHATESNFTPITPNFIIQGQDVVKVKTDVVSANDKIFFPKEFDDKTVVEVKFWSSDSNQNLQKPLFISLIVVCVPLLIIFSILIHRSISKRRQKIN